jgi:hypothetical protein
VWVGLTSRVWSRTYWTDTERLRGQIYGVARQMETLNYVCAGTCQCRYTSAHIEGGRVQRDSGGPQSLSVLLSCFSPPPLIMRARGSLSVFLSCFCPAPLFQRARGRLSVFCSCFCPAPLCVYAYERLCMFLAPSSVNVRLRKSRCVSLCFSPPPLCVHVRMCSGQMDTAIWAVGRQASNMGRVPSHVPARAGTLCQQS